MIPASARDAATYTYRVRASSNGFSACCHELGIVSVGHTVAVAIAALRAAIETKHKHS